MIVGLLVFAYFGLEALKSTFGDYRGQARQNLIMANLSEDLGEARMSVLKYRLVNNEDHRAAVRSNIDEIVEAEADIRAIIKSEDPKPV